jgi:hypothetical protein
MSEALINSDEDWDVIGSHCRKSMASFDKLPKPLQDVVRDTGVSEETARSWWAHEAGRMPTRDVLEAAADHAAAKIRKLAATAHEQELAEAAVALARVPRSLPAARRRL